MIMTDVAYIEPEWMTTEPALRYTGMNRSTFYKYRADGEIKYAKLGSRSYYSVRDLDAFMRSKLVGGGE